LEAADHGLLSPEVAAAIARAKGSNTAAPGSGAGWTGSRTTACWHCPGWPPSRGSAMRPC
jgi:hypothetical protein